MTAARSVGAVRGQALSRAAGVRVQSDIEAMFELQARALKLVPWVRNLVFLEGWKYELDFAWPVLKFAVEIEGEVHRIKERFHRDIGKHALALLAGWEILRADGRSVRDGRAIRWAQALLLRRMGLAETDSPTLIFSGPRAIGLSAHSDSAVGGR